MSSKKNPQDFKKKKAVTSAKAWKGKSKGVETDLALPSGNVCRVKRTDMPTLLASGAFPDSLMSIVSEKIGSATGKDDKPKQIDRDKVNEVANDPQKIAQLFESIDRLVPLVVVQPPVQNHKLTAKDETTGEVKTVRPLNAEERQALEDEYDGELIFTDDIELEDKMFIFQFAIGGKQEIESFRKELESAVGDVPAK